MRYSGSGILLLCIVSFLHAAPRDSLQTLELTVDGTPRSALICAPRNREGPSPLIFVFHGHGGTSRFAANKFELNKLWPDALSVYPQGLNTPGQLLDPEGKQSGWQRVPSDQNDRDLHFFDALLTKLKADYSIDPNRIYCTGHSNGGGFTFLLWYTHPDLFAAVAPCSSTAPYIRQLKPEPAMISGGKNDPIVKFQWQQATMNVVQHLNQCDATGTPRQSVATLFPSAGNTPLITYIYDGEHAMSAEEPGLIVKFFQGQTKPTTQP